MCNVPYLDEREYEEKCLPNPITDRNEIRSEYAENDGYPTLGSCSGHRSLDSHITGDRLTTDDLPLRRKNCFYHLKENPFSWEL
ncbi:unnamed protein product [Nezara viridula]|uniref:Uncharacterized protein n=1 Tax=Nezara viridula TaxID=85310 RepID=A0A9P0HB28_NEZVI|nr:unnamed protein product [Nezara viridula]